MLLLSIKAGLRAGEIAGRTWEMVSTADGKIASQIGLEDRIAKKQSGRVIPMHAELKTALLKLKKQAARFSEPSDRVVRSEEHTSELQSLMRISYAVFCLKKKKNSNISYNIKYVQKKEN